MSTFGVWAPIPEKVEIVCDGRTLAMRREAGGWWGLEIAGSQKNARYGFKLDGEGPFPDPRSPCQPDGIHELSQLVDHSVLKWEDTDWHASPLSSAVIYELHTGTFTPAGTFEAAIEKLDHLVSLGVTHVELMPVNEFSGEHGWGYDGVDLFAPHHAYGTPDQLKQLVNECHKRKLAVLLDVVCNHLGPAGNYLGKFGPYFTKKYTSPWGEPLNFDGQGSHEVRRFFCDNALMWLRDYHFDGLRLDAVHAIIDTSAEPFLEQLAREVNQLQAMLGRELVLIPESDLNDPRLLWSRDRGGFGLTAQWSDDFHHALHTVLTDERDGYYADFGSFEDLAKAFKSAFVYDGKYSTHRGRNHGRPATGLAGNRFLAYLQNHDQIGNRAKGDRSNRLMPLGRLKVGAALLMTSPFIPMLFQGEEWGASTPFQYFTDHKDPKLGEAVRQGRRQEFAAFGWDPDEIPDPQSPKTFQNSKLNWPEMAHGDHAILLDWHKKLIHLRRTEHALLDSRLEQVTVRHDEKARWFAVERGPYSVYCNLANKPQSIALPSLHQLLLASEPGIVLRDGHIQLPPDSVAILKS
jgi:maltooligosyltrehalose trehalohydrolase